MKNAYVVTGIAIVLVTLGSEACTLGSDTYITSEPGITSTGTAGDGGTKDASSAQTPSTTTPGTSGAACTGATFAKVDLAKLTPCEGGKGHCWDKAKTPMAEQLKPCANAAEVCVPDEVLQAEGKPLKSCTTVLTTPGGCITQSLIPEMEKQAGGALKPDICDPDQVCAPCANPLANNAPTPFCQPIGVYDQACTSGNAPTTPAADGGATTAPLTACCTTNGKSNGVCIAETVIREDQREDAPQDSCSSGNKCVPKAFVEGKPVTCNSGLFGSGVCMDGCFNDMLGFAGSIGLLAKDRCGASESCVPCSFLSGKGVPGCAP